MLFCGQFCGQLFHLHFHIINQNIEKNNILFHFYFPTTNETLKKIHTNSHFSKGKRTYISPLPHFFTFSLSLLTKQPHGEVRLLVAASCPHGGSFTSSMSDEPCRDNFTMHHLSSSQGIPTKLLTLTAQTCFRALLFGHRVFLTLPSSLV